MRNDTLRLLEQAVFRLENHLFQFDPEYRQLMQARQTLARRFHEGHRENHALVIETNDLLDAYTALSEYQQELRLLLGLQLGLELGSLDLLGRASPE